MTREVIATLEAPQAIGPYSQGIKAEGRFVFFSGQIALTPAGELVDGDARAQTVQIVQNIRELLKAADLQPENIVKTTIFLSSMDHFATVNEVYGSLFSGPPPARSTVAVAGLPKNVDVEIEVIGCY